MKGIVSIYVVYQSSVEILNKFLTFSNCYSLHLSFSIGSFPLREYEQVPVSAVSVEEKL